MLSRRFSRVPLIDRYFAYLARRRPSERVLLTVAIASLIAALLLLISSESQSRLLAVPGEGGTLTEGMVGAPRFVNPVLAITRVDQDLTALVYSGLMQIGSDGSLVPNLAESITVSDDGRTYRVTLKETARFSDGTPVTARDVAFTIDLIQNPELKSPLRGNWSQARVEVVTERELNFVLEEPFSPFLENLTVGILPQHIWGGLTAEEFPFSQYNTEPIGSGLYRVSDITRNSSGIISDYVLTAREDTATVPRIPRIHVTFYPNEDAVLTALTEGEIVSTASLGIETLSRLPEEGFRIHEAPLPRVFGVYFNLNRTTALRDSAARQALETAIDREALIARALRGYGEPTVLPVPSGFHTIESTSSIAPIGTSTIDAARATLIRGGWNETPEGWQKVIDDERVTLEVALTTANNDYFDATATYLAEVWEALGVPVSIALYEQADVVQTIIRPRDYQLLLFGTDTGRSLDLYPFWHSSQREDPGLNVALYTNLTVDRLLSEYRASSTARDSILTALTEEITSEYPAIFLYNPNFVYVTATPLTIEPVPRIGKPSDRFAQIDRWYLHEDRLWPFFTND
jgi:peptide/nickel transport system substrate-binding protein